MNCDDLRHRLPDLAWDALEPDEGAAITAHLRDCPGCRRELEDLRQVRGLLDAAPTPPVQVDVAAVYRAAAADAALRSRRWRRVALAACVAAAALLLVLVGRLEFRLEAHQFVVRWKAPPPDGDAHPGAADR
jgi:anti-sigma factor RsiW